MLRKFLSIALGILLVLAAGTCSLYPLYLPILKHKFLYTLKQLNLYGASINIGMWVAFTAGFIYDKYGPFISNIICLVLLPGSFIVLNIILRVNEIHINIIWLIILGLFMGQGSALAYTTALTTNLKNFLPSESSMIVGLIVSNNAISPSMFTSFRESLGSISNEDFFLLVCLYMLIVIVVCAFFLKIAKNNDNGNEYNNYKEGKVLMWFVWLNLSSLVMFLFGVIMNNVKRKNVFPHIVVVPLFLMLNFGIVLAEKIGIWDKLYKSRYMKGNVRDIRGSEVKLEVKDTNKKEDKQEEIKYENTEQHVDSNERTIKEEEETTSNDNNNNDNNNDNISEKQNQQKSINNNKSLCKILFTIDTLLLFTLLTLTIGSVISNLNNINFIITSLNINAKDTDSFKYAILYFTFNSLARIISGLYLSTIISNHKTFHYVIIISIIGLLSQISGIIMHRTIMYISISLAGLTHGLYMTFIPIYTRMFYDVNDMGTILGFLTTGNAIGSLLIGTLIFSVFYDSYKNENGECYGVHCFRGAYIITTVFMFIAFGIAMMLYIRNNRNEKGKNVFKEEKNVEIENDNI